MAAISQEQVKHIAQLSRLKLGEEEVALYTHQLGEILDYAARLPALPKGRETRGKTLRLEADEATSCPNPQGLLRNVVALEKGLVKVPAILEK